MNYKSLLFFLFMLLAACSNKNSDVAIPLDNQMIIIQGELEKGSDLLVTLDLMEPSEFVSVDSIRCDEDGKFSFNFKGDGLNFYSLKYTNEGYITVIAQAGDTISIKGNAASIYPYEIYGSKASTLLRTLAMAHKDVMDQLLQLSLESRQILGDANYSEEKQLLNLRFDSITEAFHQYSRDFILYNPDSPAILIALYNQFGPGLPVFHPLTDFEIYKFSDSALIANYPDNNAVKSLHSQLSAALQQLKTQQEKNGMLVGMSAPDFVLDSPEGNKITLSELRGNYVLLQIWATWSTPSEEENRYLKDCINRFGDKNFAILQVSIDSEEDSWKAAIKEDHQHWYHASDLRRWESAIIDLYRVERIPANFLIDPGGKIVEIDTFGDELVKMLQKYIH